MPRVEGEAAITTSTMEPMESRDGPELAAWLDELHASVRDAAKVAGMDLGGA